MKILSIEIPPTLNCNAASALVFSTNQIQESRYQITAVGNKPQIKFQFKMEVLPLQQADIDCLMQAASINCKAELLEPTSGTSNKIKAELSFNGISYILTAII